MTRRLGAVVLVLLLTGGCTTMLGGLIGESVAGQDMVNPATGAHAYCDGYVGRGDPPKADLDRMNACIASHEAMGYRRVS